MPSKFNAILLEGVCYLGPGEDGTPEGLRRRLTIQPEGKPPKAVYDILEPFLGHQVRVATHHLPAGLDTSKRGFGSCLWAEGDTCPYGHHINPHDLFNLSGEGCLVYDEGWFLEMFDGSRMAMPLAHALPGHQCRVAAATAMSVDEMRDAVVGAGVEGLDALGVRAEELKDMVQGMSDAVSGSDDG